MTNNTGPLLGRNTIRLAFVAIAALAALLLAGPRDWTDGIRTLYAAIGAVIAIGAALVLASRAGKRVDEERAAKHEAWIAGLCILGLGAAVVALALPPGDDIAGEEPEAAASETDDSGDAGPDSGEQEPASAADSRAPSVPEPGLDETIAHAGIALGRGDFAAAEEGFRRAVDLAQTEDKPDRRLTASLGLVESLLASRKPDEALELIDRTRTWAEGAFDTPPVDLVRLLVLEGTARLRQRDTAAAIPLLEEAVVAIDKHHPADLELRGNAIGALLDAQMAANQPDKGLAAINTHLRRVRAKPDATPAEIGHWLDSAGRVLGAMGRYDESIAKLEEAIALVDDGGRGDPVQVAMIRADLALSQFVSGKQALGRKTLAQARKVLDENLPEDHPARARSAAMAADFAKGAP